MKKPSHRHMLLNITQVAEDPGLRSDTDLKSASQGMFFYTIPIFCLEKISMLTES